ncbi:hypothetical protein FDF74_04145 [Clostridium niameyense]|uniref:DUF3784 domain-containing protein n=1 Tax=Clostridium niameyense TaxID=1622073 RepID=A0A6M0R866_9CLOT|nr:hypothetical protein [Clostridium niameyense]NEZ46404.1 hypothetical protein [Clostridium niameyense]
MNITSISISYLFLILGIISLVLFIYFKIIVSNTNEDSDNKDKILGNMKDPEGWRSRNNKIAYLSLFWCIVSLAIFIYLKFFIMPTLISTVYFLIYAIIVILSIFLIGRRQKERDN